MDEPQQPRKKIEPLPRTTVRGDTADPADVAGNPIGVGSPGPAPAVQRPAVEPAAGQQRRYRCYGCQVGDSPKLGFDFLADPDPKKVACPSCGVEASSARGGQLIATVSVIHYEPPAVGNRTSNVEGRNGVRVRRTHGADRVACDGADAGAASVRQLRRSGEPAAVTCPACIGSEEFKEVAGKTAIDPRFDLPVQPAAGGKLEFRGLPDDAKVTPNDG